MALLAGVLPAAAAALAADPAAEAQAFLREALRQDDSRLRTLMALQATKDRELVPLFAALCQKGEKPLRLLAAAALQHIGGDDALAALRTAALQDPDDDVRTQALVMLLESDAAPDDLLLQLLQTPSERLRLLASRGLVIRRRGEEAIETLRALAASQDPRTAALARMSLLGLGRDDHRAHLQDLLRNPQTDPALLDLLLAQIAEEKIAPAAAFAEALATSDRPDKLRLLAWRAVAMASLTGPRSVLQALPASDDLVYRVYLFRILMLSDQGTELVAELTQRTDAVGALARFERARLQGGSAATQAAAAAIATGHPVVVIHVLGAAEKDVPADRAKAAFYTPVLIDLLRSVPQRNDRATASQVLSARAGTLLADLGSPEALEALRATLAQRNRDLRSVAIAGLVNTTNPAAARLALPLLDSPYDELHVTAAMTLARFSDPAAQARLTELVTHPNRYAPQVPTMAAWYLLKLQNASASALADCIRAME